MKCSCNGYHKMVVDFMLRVVTIRLTELNQWNSVRPNEHCDSFKELEHYKHWKTTFFKIPYELRQDFYLFFHVDGSGAKGAKEIFDSINHFYD